VGINRAFGKNKAKAALALSNPANAILPADAESRLRALEAIDHPHSNLTQLDKVRGKSNFTYFADGTGVKIATKTANYTLTTQDAVILGNATSGSITITLPNPTLCYDSVGLGSIVYSIVKIDSSVNTITISPYSSETIVGLASFIMDYQNEVLSLVTDGINWYNV